MKLKGFIYAIISSIFFGSAGIFVKSSYTENFSPVDLLMLQYIIASIILLIICIIKHRSSLKLSKSMLKKLIIQGIVGNTFMTVFFYSSFKYLDMAVATMLLYLYPAMVAAISFIFLKAKISKLKIAAICGTFVGSLLVLNIFSSSFSSISLRGVLFGVLAAIFYAFMTIYAEKIVEDVPALIITFYTTVFSLVVLFIINYGFIAKIPSITSGAILNAALLAFFCEIIPLTLLYAAIKHIGSVSTSIISTIELPAAAVFSYFIMHENISLIQIIGILIIGYSVIVLKKEQ
ncbi:MAG: EamA/RhaT family transporter [Clostridiales bacterium]|jgi:drug/metabolite transporter (DMT)-like permease|nr:EamA/RhaT family transporter [Clostridiales bacterium]